LDQPHFPSLDRDLLQGNRKPFNYILNVTVCCHCHHRDDSYEQPRSRRRQACALSAGGRCAMRAPSAVQAAEGEGTLGFESRPRLFQGDDTRSEFLAMPVHAAPLPGLDEAVAAPRGVVGALRRQAAGRAIFCRALAKCSCSSGLFRNKPTIQQQCWRRAAATRPPATGPPS
jgi:hypothetical protein